MKPYGNSKTENLTCDWGCCSYRTVKTGHWPFVAKEYIRRARKRARRLGKKESYDYQNN